ncbi:MAG: glycerophosphodiester phosphodiesterase [Acidimicrobiales bacterium]
MTSRLFAAHVGPLVLAHRGTPGAGRENTLEAFAAALSLGASGVELDVRSTADGALAVHHDPELPGKGPIAELDSHDLPWWIATLGAALDVCEGAVVDVEIKNSPLETGYDPAERTARRVAALLGDERGDVRPGVFVSSFWPATLSAVKEERSSVPTGLLVHPLVEEPHPLVAQAAAAGAAVVLPFRTQISAGLVDLAHEAGLAVIPWTVDEPADLEAVVAAGVDGLVTDDVAGVLALLARLSGSGPAGADW